MKTDSRFQPISASPPFLTCGLTVSDAIELKQQREEHKCSGVKNVIKG